ncbi:hypothetical protein FRC06_000886, partial [Ceratobasidium sp. 370]
MDPTDNQPNTHIRLTLPPRTPAAAACYKSNPGLNMCPIPTVQRLTLLHTIQLAFAKNDHRFFHYDPYKSYCHDPKLSNTYRTYGEAYESQRMIDMHCEVQDVVLDEPCELPRCVAAIMIFSDATQLVNFGNAKAWPIRVTFGNMSKYERCKPDSKNHYEVGFVPSLPADLQDKIRRLEGGRVIPKALLTHLRRELFHEMWKHLLDDEFLHAWRYGVVIQCADGITRRVFPRIFSYSADYPEKSVIYAEGRAVNSKRVEQLLQAHSYVPTENTFSRRLQSFGFNIFGSLAVDFLHEFELGVWKSVFQHILRILDSTDSRSTAAFNERHLNAHAFRFRLVPSFGGGTIRPFNQDVSDMTRPAARNYEDVLQVRMDCIIPPLEGLLPRSIEKAVLTLLFVLAQWHGLTKLRRHTSASVAALQHVTTRLGHEVREFHRYTSELEVYETTREHAARQQRVRKKARPRAALAADSEAADTITSAPELGRRRKYFNIETIKFHVLGDHPESIEELGTSDSVSTQTGELLHRHDKRRYMRTNGRDYLTQMDKIQRIETRLNNIKDGLSAPKQSPSTKSKLRPAPPLVHEDLSTHDAGRSPYQIAESQKNPIIIPTGLEPRGPDPAVKDFLPRLKAHLLARILGDRYEDERTRTTSELAQIHFQHERIYAHQTLKLHYTTYDVRRAQDTINPTTSNRFILIPSDRPDSAEVGADRFWYARVLGIYHANVSHNGSLARRMDFLWVRWLARMTDVPGGWETCRLDQVGYFPDSAKYHAFEFVDPVDAIRAVHLIPRFVGNHTEEYLESLDSVAADTRSVGDWKHYYVSRFADRDLLMRFTGMAIGHMTHANAPAITIGVPAETLGTGYEYDDGLERQIDNESEGGQEGVDGTGNVEDESNGEDESENEQTDCSGDDNGLEEDDDGDD